MSLEIYPVQKCTTKPKLSNIPSDVKILDDSEIEHLLGGIILAKHVSNQSFEILVESNPDLDLSLYSGNLVYTKHNAKNHNRCHSRIICKIAGDVSDYNKDIKHKVGLLFDWNVLVPFGHGNQKASDCQLKIRSRNGANIRSVNVIGEIGHTSDLDTLIKLAPMYLSDAADNHTMAYFIIMLEYPNNDINPESVQMLFMMFLRGNHPVTEPVSVVSCGTQSVYDNITTLITELTDTSPITHAKVYEGVGYGGHPCDATHAHESYYTATVKGDIILALDRDGVETIPNIGDDMSQYDFNLSLYEIQQVALEAFIEMNQFGEMAQ